MNKAEANVSISGIKCPRCGFALDVFGLVEKGTPMQTSGPPDSWYPGDPDELVDWLVMYTCCGALTQEESDSISRAIESSKPEQWNPLHTEL